MGERNGFFAPWCFLLDGARKRLVCSGLWNGTVTAGTLGMCMFEGASSTVQMRSRSPVLPMLSVVVVVPPTAAEPVNAVGEIAATGAPTFNVTVAEAV